MYMFCSKGTYIGTHLTILPLTNEEGGLVYFDASAVQHAVHVTAHCNNNVDVFLAEEISALLVVFDEETEG